NYGCCTANMHQGWPKFVSSMWMATHDNGLAAVAYGPCSVNAIVGGGRRVEIIEETDYPFDGTIRLTVNTESPVSFPLHVRIPAWAKGASIQVGDQMITPQQTGEFVVLYRNWAPGDQVEIELPMNLRTETRFHDAVSILRGPLYFSLKIGEHFKVLRRYHDELPVVDYAVFPTTPWNYALQIDREHPEQDVKVMTAKISEAPFSHDDAPLVLKVKGRMLPEWTMKNNSADAPPQSPVVSEQPLAELELIPYGSTRLRITEFPVLAD
ncbi:MAG: beta-L-arabinofuranosidase domain-containing protein, partial [Candidatus Hinthialibacter sp.]